MSKVDFNEGVTGVLLQDWHGMERGSDQWCQEQVQLLTDKLLDEMDLEGIRAVLYEMSHKNLNEATSQAARLIEHLFKLKLSPDQTAAGHWRKEVLAFKKNLVEIFDENQNRDLLTTYREDFIKIMWKKALKFYKIDMQDTPELITDVAKTIKECPYTPEDLMDLTIAELLKKLD